MKTWGLRDHGTAALELHSVAPDTWKVLLNGVDVSDRLVSAGGDELHFDGPVLPISSGRVTITSEAHGQLYDGPAELVGEGTSFRMRLINCSRE